MKNYLQSLEKQADALLKERPVEIDKLAKKLEKIFETCEREGTDFSFEEFLRLCTEDI
ncbi:hypothetical protein [Rickettsiella endosymbiont of Rhagonycha lignosa]|uniref:hypothetical protein n=1 Tax=Rickettsiella endosymbiont of Rhagonycha lignosa TaxID=3077937 RepID=UPI00313BC72C